MPRKKASKAKKIQIGDKALTYGKQVLDMMDSNDLYKNKDFNALRNKLEMDGYIFVRGVIPNNVIMNARSAMLGQAAKDKSVIVNDENILNKGRMAKQKSKWSEGYCVDGITGSETNERANIDINAWEKIGPSKVCQDVYNGNHIQTFWKNLFGKESTKPLVKQTFLRLMGSSGTVQHADYYYFKRDTHIFNGSDGQNAQKAAAQYLKGSDLWNKEYHEIKGYDNEKRSSKYDECKGNDSLICSICGSVYDESELDNERRERLERAKNKKSDFGMEGDWHCPICAISPLSIYTTWISLSELRAPKDSILAVVPQSHHLKKWDLPKPNCQLPSDFNWKMKWVIPKSVGYGDVIIFNIKTVHASSLNKSSPRCFRCSFDTRLQLVPTKDGGKENEDVNVEKKKKKKKKIKKKIAVSPHPGLKLKSVINDDESLDISEGIDSLKLT